MRIKKSDTGRIPCQSGKLSYRSDVLRPIPHRAAIQQSVNGGRGGVVGVPHCGCWSKWGKAGGDAHYCSSRQWDRTFGSNGTARPPGRTGGQSQVGCDRNQRGGTRTFSRRCFSYILRLITQASGGWKPPSKQPIGAEPRHQSRGLCITWKRCRQKPRRKLCTSGFLLNGFKSTFLLSAPPCPPAPALRSCSTHLSLLNVPVLRHLADDLDLAEEQPAPPH